MWGINPTFLLLKGHYFAFWGGIGSISPFLGPLALQLGASPALIGIIYCTLPIFILIVKPSLGMLADALQQRKVILLATVTVTFLSFFFMIFIEPSEAPKPMFKFLRCQAKSPFLALCEMSRTEKDEYASKSGWISCDFHCGNFTSDVNLDEVTDADNCLLYPLKNSRIGNPAQMQKVQVCDHDQNTPCDVSCSGGFFSEPKEVQGITSQIVVFWILMITAYTGVATGNALGDAIVIGILPNIGLYGRQRLFGSMGYGIFALLTGFLVEGFSNQSELTNFKPCSILALILGTADFLIVLNFTAKKPNRPQHILRHACRLFARPETLLFAVAVTCVGFFTGILWTFLIVYADILGGSQELSGFIYATQTFAGEIPFMFLSGWFLRKMGHAHAMTLVLSIFAVRFLLYSMVSNPWLILPIEVTQGITFGIFFTALATYSSLIAPQATQGTMQGILQALFEGLGNGTGSLIGGFVFQAVGGSMMWLIMGLTLGVLAVVHGLILLMIQRKSNQSQPNEQQVGDQATDADNSSQNIPE